MGDGKVNKYAIVINSRSDAKGAEQTRTAVQDLRKKGYVTFAAADKKHPVWADMYVSSPANLKHMIAGLKGIVDDDDKLEIRLIGPLGNTFTSDLIMKRLAGLRSLPDDRYAKGMDALLKSGNWKEVGKLFEGTAYTSEPARMVIDYHTKTRKVPANILRLAAKNTR